MSLCILSRQIDPVDETFKNISLAVLKGKLFLAVNSRSLKEDGHVENINIRKYYGQKEDDYDYVLMDIYHRKMVVDFLSKEIIDNDIYYCLAGTDNAPSHLCYDFSLAYLRIQPQHMISIYDDYVFSLKDIEAIEASSGHFEGWSAKFKRK